MLVEESSCIASGAGESDPQLQQQMQAENRALQEELQDLGRQVRQTEASMQELAVLNQMFSTQVLHQSEQTRQLYEQVCIYEPPKSPHELDSDQKGWELGRRPTVSALLAPSRELH